LFGRSALLASKPQRPPSRSAPCLRLSALDPRSQARPSAAATARDDIPLLPRRHPRATLLPLRRTELLTHPTLDQLNQLGFPGMAQSLRRTGGPRRLRDAQPCRLAGVASGPRCHASPLLIGISMQRRGAGWWAVSGSEENKRPIEIPLPDDLTPWIDRYLEYYRASGVRSGDAGCRRRVLDQPSRAEPGGAC